MTAEQPAAPAPTAPVTPPAPSRARQAVTAIALVAVVAAAGFVLYRDRDQLADAASLLSWWVIGLSAIPAAIGVALNGVSWVAVLHGLRVQAPTGAGLRVFCVTQLGKYLPGSVWPAVGQMSAGRRWNASPRTMLTANLFALVIGLVSGLLVACVTLPWSGAAAFSRFWWLLIVAPVLLVLLVPRVLPAALDKILALARRAPLGERVPVAATARSSAWAVGAWLFFGIQTYLLCVAAGYDGPRTAIAALGASAFAICVGVLAIPFPAGAGVRETAFVLALSATVPSAVALVVAIAARLTLVVVDLGAAGVSAAWAKAVDRPPPAPSPPADAAAAEPRTG